MRWWQVANDIVHDLSAGAWPGAAASLWLIRSHAVLPEGALSITLPALSSVYLIMFATLALLVVTGALRVNYRASSSAGRTRVVLIKHAAFVAVFILAIVVSMASLRP